jgi:eukaryotic-like serine/threonine-protein kinase
MSLASGARLGAYAILSKLGSGGMGDVYRARDTRLDRDVAIKVLPQHLATDEAARARFEREAKAIAALSHPNILAVYDVGAVDEVAFVVMELLEGETLRQRLSESAGGSSALSIRKVTQIGIEIAQGLAAAHDKQIVHRDVKPENIFIAADGRVKILDFGLARQTGPVASGPSDAATQLQHTDPGTVLGTIGYMAPEQVKGGSVDHRADIFSLGCVLYEMATGRRPFARDTAAETMTAILRDDPPDLVRESGAIPAAFEPIVRHSLEKRPEERFQSARDLAFALQSIGSGTTTTSSVGSVAPAINETRRRYSFVLPALVAVGAAAAAFFAGRATGGGAPAPAAGIHVESFQQLTDTPGVDTAPTVSPDGKTVVFASDRDGTNQIYSQRVGSRTSVALTSGPDNTAPAFSPEGERIAFRSERAGGGIFLMSASGESVTRVSDEGYAPTWSPAGDELALAYGPFFSPNDASASKPGLLTVDLASGKKREVLRGTQVAMQPAWSPHGQRIAFYALRPNSGQRDIFTVLADGSAADAPPVEVTNDAALDWTPVWSPNGDYLYFSSNRGGTMNLWRIGIDEVSGRPRGAPEPVTTPTTYGGRMSFSRDGLLMAYASLDWRSTLLRQSFDAGSEQLVGPPIPMFKGSRPVRDHAISPDGEWVVFNETTPQEDLFIARVDGREYRRLTDDASRDRGPVWSPDGQTIYFYSDRSGRYELWKIRSDGSHAEVMTKDANTNFPTVSPDGKQIATAGVSAGGMQIRAASAPVGADNHFEPAPGSGQMFWPFSWSQSNRLVGIVVTIEGAVAGVSTYDIATKQYRPIPVDEYRSYATPLWLRDGRRVLLRAQPGIELVDSVTGARKMLTRVRGYMVGKSLSVSADNTWYSYTETGTEGDIWMARIKR